MKLPKGYENLGSLPVLGDKPTAEQLKAALKTKKPDCTALLANYQCGQNDIPSVPTGDIIQPNVGDEIAINSIAFEIVDLDGSGNGRGIVKVPMFNNAKFGVKFEDIKVAKGGCVVSGQAILSDVDVALLSEEQRKKLAETYATFNKVLAIADSLAPEIAETYNSIADLLKAVRAKARAIIDKIAKNEKPSTQELKNLTKLSETAIEAKKKELERFKKQAGADTSKYVASLGTWLVKQDNALACVKTLPGSEPDTKVKKGGPFFYEGSYFGGCDISALTEEEPENSARVIPCEAPEPKVNGKEKDGDKTQTKGIRIRTCKECEPKDCVINWVYFSGREGSTFKPGWYTEAGFKQIPLVLGSVEPIVFIHGTFSFPDTFTEDFKQNVINAISFKGVTKSVSVEWSGDNSVPAREDAANGLITQLKTKANQLKLKNLGMEKHLVLISHSHGGNVAKSIKNKLETEGWRIDVVNIETPQRGDFQANKRGDGVYLSFYYGNDAVQQMGSRSLLDWSFFLQSWRKDKMTLQNIELVPNYTSYVKITHNVLAGVYVWYLDSAGHGLHNNPIVQPQIIKNIETKFNKIYK